MFVKVTGSFSPNQRKVIFKVIILPISLEAGAPVLRIKEAGESKLRDDVLQALPLYAQEGQGIPKVFRLSLQSMK